MSICWPLRRKIGVTALLAAWMIWGCTGELLAQATKINKNPPNELFEALIGAQPAGTAPQSTNESAVIVCGRIPRPRFESAEDPKQRDETLDSIFGIGDERERYFRRSIVAPQILKLEKVAHSPESLLRIVHFWFIAYGDLSKLDDKELTNQMMLDAKEDSDADNGDQTAESREVTAEELAQCSITAPSAPTSERNEFFSRVNMHLFKKLDLDLTMHVISTRSSDQLLSAAVVDSRFADCENLKNQWRRLQRDEAGALAVHSQGGYADAGGYLRLVQFDEPEQAILVEGHFAFLEPHGWFDGANLLGSKMPTLVQISARRLRKSLLKTLP